MQRKWFGLGMGLILALSVYPLLQHKHAYWLFGANGNDNTLPDFIVYHAVTHHYSANGLLKETLFSEKTEFFKTSHITRVTHPYLIGYHDKVWDWRITADLAEQTENPSRIVLHGHVTLYQPQNARHTETTLHTDSLTYYPQQGLAITEDPVDIHQPQSHFSAVGMEYHLKTGTLIAHAKSRGQYALK